MQAKLSVVALSVVAAFALSACGQKEEPKPVAAPAVPAAPAAKPEVLELAKNIAMQVAAASPMALDAASLDQAAVEREREVYRQKALEEGKPANIVDKIADGAVKKFQKDVCLMEQPYIRDDKKTISDIVRETGKTIGDEITVTGFERIQLAAE